jgi:hypothetical protein
MCVSTRRKTRAARARERKAATAHPRRDALQKDKKAGFVAIRAQVAHDVIVHHLLHQRDLVLKLAQLAGDAVTRVRLLLHCDHTAVSEIHSFVHRPETPSPDALAARPSDTFARRHMPAQSLSLHARPPDKQESDGAQRGDDDEKDAECESDWQADAQPETLFAR